MLKRANIDVSKDNSDLCKERYDRRANLDDDSEISKINSKIDKSNSYFDNLSPKSQTPNYLISPLSSNTDFIIANEEAKEIIKQNLNSKTENICSPLLTMSK